MEGYDVDGILILSDLEQISIKGNGIKIGADAKEVLELSSTRYSMSDRAPTEVMHFPLTDWRAKWPH